MRKQQIYTINGALMLGASSAVLDVILQWIDHVNIREKFTWQKYNGFQTLKNGLRGAAVGALLGYSYYEYLKEEEYSLPFNPDAYLRRILSNESLKLDQDLLQQVLDYRGTVKSWLYNHFQNELVSKPEDVGSFHKRTAVLSNFDLDIVLPFKYASYSTLEEMYNSVYHDIAEHFSDKARVIKQTKAIGLTFATSKGEICFDIIPGREINNYRVDKNLNLYVRPEWIWQRGTSFKANIYLQKNATVNMPEVRQVIKLLKIYRDRNGLHLPAIIIEHCVLKALTKSQYSLCGSVTENLLNCMDYIVYSLDRDIVIDSTNSNNNLGNKLTAWQKDSVVKLMSQDIKAIESNLHFLKEVFND